MSRVYKEVVNVISYISPVCVQEDLDCDTKQFHTIHQEAKLKKIAEILKRHGYFEEEFIAPEFTS